MSNERDSRGYGREWRMQNRWTAVGEEEFRAGFLKGKQPEGRKCVFCTLLLKPTKLKRQYVHHIAKEGRIVVCTENY